MKDCCGADPKADGTPSGIVQDTYGPPSGWLTTGCGSDKPKGY